MPILKPFLTTHEVLKRALELMNEPLPARMAKCAYKLGPYCTRCACSRATTELAEHLSYDAGDDALRDAAMQVSIAGDGGFRPLSWDEAKAVLLRALEQAAQDEARHDV